MNEPVKPRPIESLQRILCCREGEPEREHGCGYPLAALPLLDRVIALGHGRVSPDSRRGASRRVSIRTRDRSYGYTTATVCTSVSTFAESVYPLALDEHS